ncbi:MAG: AbrB/MazE/SpoVT family DNA-binding domain-containing protein [Pirellulales bacterium]
MSQVTVSLNQAGDVPLPLAMRRELGIDTGSVVTLETQNGAIVIRPVETEVEVYSPERQAEFLLSNSVDANDYASAREEVRRMGLDPDHIPHHRPAGV